MHSPPCPEPWCSDGFTSKNTLEVPPKSSKNPPTMVNFKVVFAVKRLDLLMRAIYKSRMVCPKCQANVSSDSNFCPRCGTPFKKQSGFVANLWRDNKPGFLILSLLLVAMLGSIAARREHGLHHAPTTQPQRRFPCASHSSSSAVYAARKRDGRERGTLSAVRSAFR